MGGDRLTERERKRRCGVIKERNDWTEDGRYPSRSNKTSVKQQAETLIVRGENCKGHSEGDKDNGSRIHAKTRENNNERERERESRQTERSKPAD